jgi:hypothetical protein
MRLRQIISIIYLARVVAVVRLASGALLQPRQPLSDV